MRVSEPPPITKRVQWSQCEAPLELLTEGLPGFWGYHTFNAYICPRCGKQSHERTAGAIASVRVLSS
jgi:hypothetical protein